MQCKHGKQFWKIVILFENSLMILTYAAVETVEG